MAPARRPARPAPRRRRPDRGRSRLRLASRANRARIDPSIRREAARALAGRAVEPDLIAFFAEDNAVGRGAADRRRAARVRGEWLALLPRLGPAARALLRHRRDLPPEVETGARRVRRQRLRPRKRARPSRPRRRAAERESQIRELVERIEAFRRHKRGGSRGRTRRHRRASRRKASAGKPAPTASCAGSRARRARPLVGQSIAAIAGPGQYGVDGQAAGAFEKKRAVPRCALQRRRRRTGGGRLADFRRALLRCRTRQLPRLSRHRPAPAGRRDCAPAAKPAPSGLFGHPIPGQFAAPADPRAAHAAERDHRLRRNDRGPVYGPGRDRLSRPRRRDHGAGAAACSARSTISTRRRGSRPGGFELEESAVDAVALLGRLHESYERIADQRGSRLTLSVAPDLPPARVEPGAVERMFARLLAATIGLAGRRRDDRGRDDRGDVAATGRCSACRSTGPQAIDGLDEAALLDPGYSPDGDWPGAPALGLGFALQAGPQPRRGGRRRAADRRRALLALPAGAGRGAARPAARQRKLKPRPRTIFWLSPARRAMRRRCWGWACSSTVEPAAHNG